MYVRYNTMLNSSNSTNSSVLKMTLLWEILNIFYFSDTHRGVVIDLTPVLNILFVLVISCEASVLSSLKVFCTKYTMEMYLNETCACAKWAQFRKPETVWQRWLCSQQVSIQQRQAVNVITNSLPSLFHVNQPTW